MLKIQKEQMDMLDAHMMRVYEDRVMRTIKHTFSERYEQDGDDKTRQFVQAGVRKADDYSITGHLLANTEFRRPETSAISVYDQSRFSGMVQVDFPVCGPHKPDTTPQATAPGPPWRTWGCFPELVLCRYRDQGCSREAAGFSLDLP